MLPSVFPRGERLIQEPPRAVHEQAQELPRFTELPPPPHQPVASDPSALLRQSQAPCSPSCSSPSPFSRLCSPATWRRSGACCRWRPYRGSTALCCSSRCRACCTALARPRRSRSCSTCRWRRCTCCAAWCWWRLPLR